MPSGWVKQPQQISALGGAGKLNGGAGDTVVGGLLTGVPAGLNISAGMQDIPGDRMVLGEEDAAAVTNTAIGTLYGGLYQYVVTKLTSTATPTINRAMFWDTAVANSTFQTTPDESGSQGVAPFAGVNIQTLTKGNAWWIQSAGRVAAKFVSVFTGIPSNGCPVYLAAAGAGADVASFDVLDGAGNPTFTQVGQMLQRYVGWAQGLPAADTASTINIPLRDMFRW
jgi:hypothetical protein